MSQHQSFKRVAVPAQVAQKLDTITLPAPTRGLVLNENEAFMQPGSAVVCDNWKPTLRGVSLRGGYEQWLQLPETTPVISSFQYVSGADNHQMFACNATKVYNVTTVPAVAVATGRTSGNYAAAQMSNGADDWLIVVNDAGNAPLRYDGTSWEVLTVGYVPPGGKPSTIDVDLVKYPGARVDGGANLVYVCKYRNRFFFIELNSMNAWYLPLNAVGGMLEMVPLSGAATKGGKLLFCCTWSIDAGDGVDDKLIFMTNLGEIIVFTGGDPSSAANWRQEGRFTMSPPLGMNAHLAIGGDVVVATIDGVLPVSAAITKDRAELELAAISRNINQMWREEAIDKRNLPWTFCKWDEYGAVFTTLPGDLPGKHKCLVTNSSTGAWSRYTGWDARCWLRLRGDMFFGTRDGRIMQADRTGYDNGKPYVATLVGGWEMFQSPSQTLTWRQARATFTAKAGEPFVPQLSATTDFIVVIPSPPAAGIDPGLEDLWDEGLWADALWDKGVPHPYVTRNTGWVSIGMTGFSHAPIVQVMVAQHARPVVDLINIAATFERAGVNV
jgi:hypothetical protein